MSATVRIRLLVGAAALLAAGVVAGVVLATRQTPAQPKRQCSTLTAEFFAGAGDPAARPPVRAALANWPRGTVGRLEALARRYPKDPGVLYNYGRALLCAGYFSDAETALESAKRRGRNTWYEIRADNILHPQYFAGGYPIFQPQR